MAKQSSEKLHKVVPMDIITGYSQVFVLLLEAHCKTYLEQRLISVWVFF